MFIVPFIISVVFFVFWMYACDTANLGDEENVKFKTSVKHLFEEKDSVDYYNIDDYIDKTLLPNYRHYELYYKISNYQNSENSFGPAIVVLGFLSAWGATVFVADGFEPIWAFVISLIINLVIYLLITLLFAYTPIFKKLKLKNYSDVCDTYLSEYHYKYLREIEESVMFRYFLRKIIGGIAAFLFLMNIWSTDIY